MEKPLILSPDESIVFSNPWPRDELEPTGTQFVAIQVRVPLSVRAEIEEVLPQQGGLQTSINHLIRLLIDAKQRYGIKDYNDRRAFQLLLTRGELILPGGSPTSASAGSTTVATVNAATNPLGRPASSSNKTPRGNVGGRVAGAHPAVAQRTSQRSDVSSGVSPGVGSTGKTNSKKGKDQKG